MSLKRASLPIVQAELPILSSPHLMYSIVIPLYNDAGTLPVLHQRVSGVVQDLSQLCEIAYVLAGMRIIGEYIGRIYTEVQGRPYYLIRALLDRGAVQ